MGISNAAGASILNKEFNAANYSPAATLYIGFFHNGTELTGGSYARIAVTVDTDSFPTTTTTLISNGEAFETPQASADWSEADEVGIFVASSGGTARYRSLLDSPFTVLNGQKRSFGIGALRIRLI
jgi:hypothetical protein